MFKISIIIPVFNVEDYIEAAFDSLLNQTIGFDNLEIIFVDDASTDNSSLIIDEYSNKYDNVVSIHLDKNSGAAGKPRNVAMCNASADYLMFLDPDDVFINTACEVLYDEIISDNLDVVSGIHTLNGGDIQPILWKHILTDPYMVDRQRMQIARDTVKDSNFNLKFDSIDDCPRIINNFGMWSKIYKKSFLESNNINFLEGIPAQDTVFLFNVLLKAKGIKFINKVITDHLTRDDSISFEFTKNRVKERLDAYYEMFYISCMENKVDLFKYYILFNKLNYFLKQHLMICNLSTNEIVDILEYSAPLFKLCVMDNTNINGPFAKLFEYIANKDYENALIIIQGECSLIQNDIKIVSNLNQKDYSSFKYEDNFINCTEKNWFNQFDEEKPDIFVYIHPDNKFSLDTLSTVLEYCNYHNIKTIFLNNENEFIGLSLKFDYIFNLCKDASYSNYNHKNIYYLDKTLDDIDVSNLKQLNNLEFCNSFKKQSFLNQIFEKIDDKYIPKFIHITLGYELNNLTDLGKIYKHFNSIQYSYKHIKLIATSSNNFLSNTISKEDFENLKLNNKYYSMINI